jgi:hypothetical protein
LQCREYSLLKEIDMKKIFTILFFLFCASLNAQKIYWTDGSSGKIQSGNIDGTGIPSDVLTGVSSCFAAGVNLTTNELYWTDFSSNTISKINLTTLTVNVLVNSSAGVSGPRGLAIDADNNRMFWADNITKKIQRSDLSGSGVTDIVSTGLISPGYVAYDPLEQKVYFADNGLGMKKIMRCNPDGSSLEDVVTGLDQVWGIAFNSDNNNIYWIDSGIDKIQRGNVTTLPVTKVDLITGLTGSLRGLVIDANPANNKLYWTDISTGEIKRADIDGTNVITLFSSISYPQGIAINWDSALPVELASFISTVDMNKVFLNWQTVSEVNNSGFDIERKSAEGTEWTKVGNVTGSGTVSEPVNYSFTDQNLNTGAYNYRLKQIDYNGNFEYFSLSNEVIIGIPEKFTLSQNYPNPFNPVTRIGFNLPGDGSVDLRIYDINGREVIKLLSGEMTGGYQYIDFNAPDLSSGVYFYRMIFNSSTNVFTDTKKLMLMK